MLRIVPGYVVAFLLSAFLVGPLIYPDTSAYWGQFKYKRLALSMVTLERPVTPGVGTNGSLWTIHLEFLCYLGVLALGLARLLRWPILLLMLALACSLVQVWNLFLVPASQESLPGWTRYLVGEWPRLGACFLAGGVFHLWGHRIPHSARLAALAGAGLFIATGFPSAKMLPILFPYLGGYLIFWVAYANFGRMKDMPGTASSLMGSTCTPTRSSCSCRTPWRVA